MQPNPLNGVRERTMMRLKAYLAELEVECEHLRTMIDDSRTTIDRLEARRMLALLMTARINLTKLINEIPATREEEIPPNTSLH